MRLHTPCHRNKSVSLLPECGTCKNQLDLYNSITSHFYQCLLLLLTVRNIKPMNFEWKCCIQCYTDIKKNQLGTQTYSLVVVVEVEVV